MYRVDEVNDEYKRDNDGDESENSDRIKELFNQMLTNQDENYDIKNDALLIRENEDQEDLLGLAKKKQEAANRPQNQIDQIIPEINSQVNHHQ